jgi:RNA polymerase sigma-70 factor (ECF subfamily)
MGMTGDAEESFEDFYVAQYERLCRAVYLIGGASDVEDITQDAFCRVLERWDRVRQMESPEGYVFVTAARLARRHQMRRSLSKWSHAPEAISRDHADSVATSSTVRAVLERLPRGDRELLILTRWLELDTGTCARLLSISNGAARVRAHRARQRFIQLIEETDHG